MSTYALYGGAVSLTYGERAHSYLVTDPVVGLDDAPMANVTNITGVIAKQMDKWKVGLALDTVQNGLKPGRSLNEVEIMRLLASAEAAADKVRNEASYVGKATHSWVEEYVKGRMEGSAGAMTPPVHPAVRAAAEAFVAWDELVQPTYLASERKVYSREHAYVGTMDLFALVDPRWLTAWREAKSRSIAPLDGPSENTHRVVFDCKTNNRIFVEAHLQVGAYSQALIEEGESVDDRVILHLPKEGGKRLRPIVCGDLETDIETFLAARKVYRRIFGK